MSRSGRLVGLSLLVAACHQPGPPAPTVALAESARPGVMLVRGSDEAALTPSRRVEEGATVKTPAAGRASLRLDGGAWALVDAGSRVKVGAGALA
ncbi:MAG TPA: hypothetical protein VMZ28_20500, partial [Kofleriaceae bacterium]|nr:hypothetical protein [Kofleriaceae bacterium]